MQYQVLVSDVFRDLDWLLADGNDTKDCAARNQARDVDWLFKIVEPNIASPVGGLQPNENLPRYVLARFPKQAAIVAQIFFDGCPRTVRIGAPQDPVGSQCQIRIRNGVVDHQLTRFALATVWNRCDFRQRCRDIDLHPHVGFFTTHRPATGKAVFGTDDNAKSVNAFFSNFDRKWTDVVGILSP